MSTECRDCRRLGGELCDLCARDLADFLAEMDRNYWEGSE
jgi:hypothetical protein